MKEVTLSDEQYRTITEVLERIEAADHGSKAVWLDEAGRESVADALDAMEEADEFLVLKSRSNTVSA